MNDTEYKKWLIFFFWKRKIALNWIKNIQKEMVEFHFTVAGIKINSGNYRTLKNNLYTNEKYL